MNFSKLQNGDTKEKTTSRDNNNPAAGDLAVNLDAMRIPAIDTAMSATCPRLRERMRTKESLPTYAQKGINPPPVKHEIPNCALNNDGSTAYPPSVQAGIYKPFPTNSDSTATQSDGQPEAPEPNVCYGPRTASGAASSLSKSISPSSLPFFFDRDRFAKANGTDDTIDSNPDNLESEARQTEAYVPRTPTSKCSRRVFTGTGGHYAPRKPISTQVREDLFNEIQPKASSGDELSADDKSTVGALSKKMIVSRVLSFPDVETKEKENGWPVPQNGSFNPKSGNIAREAQDSIMKKTKQ